MPMSMSCFECGATIDADDPVSLGEAFLAHARSAHDWPYPDQAIRNYAEATHRLTGPSERLATIGEVTVHQVTADRVDDWLSLFDHEAFVGRPEWAACYCMEPHRGRSAGAGLPDDPHWRDNRAAMVERLTTGATHGYLAYVDGHAAGWTNASLRSEYRLYADVDPVGPAPDTVIGVSCYIISPPYRRHGLASALLDRVIADAAGRGAAWVEAYPFNEAPDDSDGAMFRGPRSMYQERGFEVIEVRERDSVVRRPV
jgi:GNAT superfamily N-acetyltransferase